MGTFSSDPATEQLARDKIKDGWTVEKTAGNHIKFKPPFGKEVIHAGSTPSDHRAIKNLEAQIKRVESNGRATMQYTTARVTAAVYESSGMRLNIPAQDLFNLAGVYVPMGYHHVRTQWLSKRMLRLTVVETKTADARRLLRIAGGKTRGAVVAIGDRTRFVDKATAEHVTVTVDPANMCLTVELPQHFIRPAVIEKPVAETPKAPPAPQPVPETPVFGRPTAQAQAQPPTPVPAPEATPAPEEDAEHHLAEVSLSLTAMVTAAELRQIEEKMHNLLRGLRAKHEVSAELEVKQKTKF